MRGNLARLLLQLLNRHQHSSTAYSRGATAKSADAILDDAGVAVDHSYIVNAHAKFIGGDLRKRSFLSLAVRRCAGKYRDFAGGFDAHRRALPAAGGHCLRWAEGADFDVTRHPDTDQLSFGARFLLIFAQLLVTGKIERLIKRGFIITAVVIQTRRGMKRELSR